MSNYDKTDHPAFVEISNIINDIAEYLEDQVLNPLQSSKIDNFWKLRIDYKHAEERSEVLHYLHEIRRQIYLTGDAETSFDDVVYEIEDLTIAGKIHAFRERILNAGQNENVA